MLNKGLMGGAFVVTPSITNPTASEIDDTITPTITSSAFVAFGGLTHYSTDWQVASDSGFSTIVWESLNDTTNKTSVTAGALGGGTRYVRCRYKSNSGLLSSYSSSIEWTSPWAAGSNLTITTPTNADVNATSTVTFQSGTYRITVWGAVGGKGAGSGGTAGAGGSVRKTVTYPSPAPVTITIGQGGGEGHQCDPTNPPSCVGPSAGGPGYGAGGASGYFTNPNGTWMGGGGGGSSHFDGMIAGGGGGGMAGGNVSPVGGGGQATGAGGCNTYGSGGSSGTNGGGGGAGAHVSGGATGSCEAGEGGNNSGTFDDEWDASGATVANPYSSPAYSRTFGSGNGNAGGGRIEKM